MPIRSVLASTKLLIVWGMSNPFLRGGDTGAAIVALTLGELVANYSIVREFQLQEIYTHIRVWESSPA